MINFALYNATRRMLELYEDSANGDACEHVAQHYAAKAQRIAEQTLYAESDNS